MLALTASIYDVTAIESAVELFADFGTFEWEREPVDGYYNLKIESADDVELAELLGGFGNFVLTKTLETRH